MFKRIYYQITKNQKHSFVRLGMLFGLFCFLGTSFFLWHLSNGFEKDFESQNELLVTLSSSVGRKSYEPQSLEEYQALTRQYFDDYNHLQDLGIITYSDMNLSSGMATQFVPVSYNGEKWEILFQYISESDIDQHYRFRIDFFDNHSSLSPLRPKAVFSADFMDSHFGAIVIENGRSFTREEMDAGEHVCVVPTDAVIYDGEVQHLKPGDEIPLAVYRKTEGQIQAVYESKCTIVGEYEMKKTLGNDVVPIEYPVYIPMRYYLEATAYLMPTLEGEEKIADRSYRFQPVVLQVKSFEDLEKIIEEIERSSLYLQGYTQYSSNIQNGIDLLANLSSMSGSFRLLTTVCVIVCIIAGIVFTLIDFRYRCKEFAVYVSLGLSKKELMKQLFVENILALSVVYLCAVIVSWIGVRGLVHILFNNYLQYQISGTIALEVFFEMLIISMAVSFCISVGQWWLLRRFSLKGTQYGE